MIRLFFKAKLETRLLEIWYGGSKSTTLESFALNILESVYKGLRAFGRHDSKSAHSKTHTNPPVLVIGNLIAGGAGKTPLVMAVCQFMQLHGKKVGIVSRGYGRRSSHAVLIDPREPLPVADEVGDEPLFLCAQTHCPVAVGADRNAALSLLFESYPDLDLVVSDDGLQHHRMRRQLEWVVFDSRGQGNGRMLPAGPLREPLSRLNSVDAVIASNCSVGYLSQCLNMPRDTKWHEVTVRLIGFKHLQTGEFLPSKQAAKQWANLGITAFSGMANPNKLFSAVEALGIKITQKMPLPDHFDYPADFCMQFDQSILITSGKDAVKLNSSNSKVWVAEIHVELPPALTLALEDSIGPTID
ncbi:tetraacyldisaccharide 4'-kinase [Limnobacter parvus]|uniref:Tetraacyldisaccharide 4'-kinase n=1 Tax=Limnobacter parvus TaxID=2939690 RepID=A0ABT1XKF5_9BURK|nr:tetraacyldisaccharide 4'-kinase [Limnobacter parvus]MCR2747772.1 tetraacyldisaccharide 4'-kinase [Limnobacter parvus]